MKKILLIEDCPEHLNETKVILEGAGYKVLTVSDEDIASVEEILVWPDLIITTLSLKINGLGLILRLQQAGYAGPAIIMTDFSLKLPGIIPVSKLVGATILLAKPFKPKQLLRAVKTCFKVRPHRFHDN